MELLDLACTGNTGEVRMGTRVGHGKWIMMAGHFFDGSYIYKQDLSRVFFIIHHLPSQFCRFLRDKNGKKWQISAGYNSCYSGSILLGVVTR